VGGDFNLIRGAEDKNNANLNWPRIHLFKDCLARLALREINRIGARFTWTNKQLNPVRSVLDRVFVSPEWKSKFPLASLVAEMRIGSDHNPLVLDFGEGPKIQSSRFFFKTS
jgi:endonuclease/exonuclease/phosphatase (EEP) superfamily protein YafD